MSDGVIEQMCIRLAQYPFERMRIVWHGGEPMLAGLHFYEKAVACQKKYLRNRRVINSIQTNGTLIDKQWCEFFKTNDFSVGVSLDGPRNLNTSRTYPNGLEAFDNIIRGVENLRKYGVKYGLLSVLDKKIIGQEQSFYDFVRSISDSIRLNFVVPYGLIFLYI